MLALADAVSARQLPSAEIALVVSDQPGAAGVGLALARGLNAVVIERQGRTRAEHDREIVAALKGHGVELVCLAGYLRLLSPFFIESYRDHILNIHPSLLPSFPGLDAQQQVLVHGVKWTGCTVHFVDETLDGGPIVAQRPVPVRDDDTEETLAARILQEEHLLYREALSLVLGGEFEIKGRRVLGPRKVPQPEG
ncbi:MAG: phosphoribosylglycinamide formyltransferase 1 [Pyrinomonadaceae bacterium]|nr:phosphoribosylglycinamide formyltransferase 1 [Pyrinomonadaceae bacterium]